MAMKANSEQATFGLLPEPERSPGSFITSIVINGLALLLLFLLGATAKKEMDRHRYEETLLMLPTKPPPPEQKVKLPPPPKVDLPRPPDLMLEAPKIDLPAIRSGFVRLLGSVVLLFHFEFAIGRFVHLAVFQNGEATVSAP